MQFPPLCTPVLWLSGCQSEIGLSDLFFRLIPLSDQILSALRCQVAPPKLMIADPDQSLLTAGKLHFSDLIFDKRMLPQDVVAVMPVQNGFVPHNDAK